MFAQSSLLAAVCAVSSSQDKRTSMLAVSAEAKSNMQVDGSVVSKIGPGLLCLVGIRDGDTATDAAYL